VLGGNQLAILNCGSKNFPSKNIAIYLVSERDKGGGDEEDSDEEDSDEEDRDEEDRDEEDSNEQDRDEEDSNEQISDEQDSDEEDSDEKFRAWDRAMWYKGNFKRILCHKLEFLEYKDVASSLQTIYIQRESALWDVD
jgi:hypothetical protein